MGKSLALSHKTPARFRGDAPSRLKMAMATGDEREDLQLQDTHAPVGIYMETPLPSASRKEKKTDKRSAKRQRDVGSKGVRVQWWCFAGQKVLACKVAKLGHGWGGLGVTRPGRAIRSSARGRVHITW